MHLLSEGWPAPGFAVQSSIKLPGFGLLMRRASTLHWSSIRLQVLGLLVRTSWLSIKLQGFGLLKLSIRLQVLGLLARTSRLSTKLQACSSARRFRGRVRVLSGHQGRAPAF